MADEAPPYLKTVIFDLPFVIFVRDGFRDATLEAWAEAVQRREDPPYSAYAPPPNKPIGVTIAGAAPVYIPPTNAELAPAYRVYTSNLRCVLRFLRRVNPHHDPVIFAEVPGDRTGRVSFSTVQALFDPRGVPNDSVGMDGWVRYALEAVNHFIDHYRVVAGRPYLSSVTASVIQRFRIGTQQPGEDGFRWQLFGSGSGAAKGFGGAIPEHVDSALRESIVQPFPPDFTAALRVEVLSYIELGNYRLAAIESAVLFEAFLVRTVRRYLRMKGRTEEQVDRLLNRDDGRPHEAEYIAKKVIRLLADFDFAATHQFRDWKEKVADLRNDLVHGRRPGCSRDEALASFKAVDAAAWTLRGGLFGERPQDAT